MEQEGVIKYTLDFRERVLQLPAGCVQQLNACRKELRQLGLLGQDEHRYDGCGFGNVSLRPTGQANHFVVSGSQTGHLEQLEARHIVQVCAYQLGKNWLSAEGECMPSSEALSHAALYAVSAEVQAVVHVHAPDIWYHAESMGLACTPSHLPYGTPEMATALQACAGPLLRQKQTCIIAMKGHQDGVIVAGKNISECTRDIIALHERAQLFGGKNGEKERSR